MSYKTLPKKTRYAIIERSMQIERKFYSNVKLFLAINGAFGLCIGIIPLLLGATPAWIWIAIGASLVVLGTIMFLGARKVWPVHAGPNGLKTYDGLGIYSDLPWTHILSATSACGYYWIRTTTGKTLCVPTYLEEMAEFKAYVHRHAPIDNPLREAM